MRLPHPERSRAVLIGTGKYADKKLPDLPVVGRTIDDLAAALTDPVHGVITKNQCTVLEDQGDIRLIGRHLRSAASQAEDLFLVYFVGHGLVGGRRHELYLGLPDSEWAEPEFNSLEYDKLRNSVLDSAARAKIIVLDCCFSGRVISGAMASLVTEVIGKIEVDGTYVLASAERDQVALILPGEDHTAFTGRFLQLLRNGVPAGPELLTIDYLYQQLVTRMRAEGLSIPQKRATSTVDLLALTVNRAFTAAQTRMLAGHYGAVVAVAFSPDGRLLATGSVDRTARLWDPTTGDCLRTLTGHHDGLSRVAFSPDGKLLATASGDETARLWDPATGDCLRTLTGHSGGVRDTAFSPDGRLLATASFDDTVRLWDPATGDCLRILTEETMWAVFGVAFSPDGRLLASASIDDTVRLWDPATGDCLRTLTGHHSGLFKVAFSPDGKLLATASHDETARLWDPATGDCLRVLTSHSGSVTGAAFSPDGKLLATVSADTTGRLWDPATGDCLRTLTGHSRGVTGAAFSPIGKLLATASGDKTVLLWE